MTESGQFTATYRDFRKNTEELTTEIDRLTDAVGQMDEFRISAQAKLEDLNATSESIKDEVQKAVKAWGNGSEVSKSAAKKAYEEAYSGTISAGKELQREMRAITQEAESVARRLESVGRLRASIWAAFILILVVAYAGGVYSAPHLQKFLNDSWTQAGSKEPSLHDVWAHSTEQERETIRKILKRTAESKR
ncbi:hypothetical protein [Pseudomonas sp. OTU750018]|uniref:hypothetical protein n=1 Tax=Pseudomonas sp. OTU750018 TaxID=2709708 RepID=UPI001424420A|nr:hypothetical protein [Pseudomonas sp. OTU750018]